MYRAGEAQVGGNNVCINLDSHKRQFYRLPSKRDHEFQEIIKEMDAFLCLLKLPTKSQCFSQSAIEQLFYILIKEWEFVLA